MHQGVRWMSDSSHLQRYRLGEREAVWRELMLLGSSALAEPRLSEARAVAEEVVGRAHHNLKLLRDRLVVLGYRFSNPDDVLVDADETDIASVVDLERSMGTLPLVVRTWYQRIASVDFRQHPDQLRHHEGTSTAPRLSVVGLGFQVPLVFLRIQKCLELRNAVIAE